MRKFFSKNYFLNIVLLLANVGLFVFAFYFLSREVVKDAQDLFDAKKNILLLKEKRSNFEILKKDYQSYQKEVEETRKVFIDAETPIDFIRFLEEISDEAGLSVKISPGGTLTKDKNEPWPSINFQLSFQDEPNKILIFAEKLENSPYLLKILDFNLDKSKENETVKASFVIRAYTK